MLRPLSKLPRLSLSRFVFPSALLLVHSVVDTERTRQQTPVIQDNPPIFKSFGDVLSDVRTSSPYSVGETVRAWFVGANPRVRPFMSLLHHIH